MEVGSSKKPFIVDNGSGVSLVFQVTCIGHAFVSLQADSLGVLDILLVVWTQNIVHTSQGVFCSRADSRTAVRSTDRMYDVQEASKQVSVVTFIPKSEFQLWLADAVQQPMLHPQATVSSLVMPVSISSRTCT
jgi:hypothetical protein